jgi:hypothetical protein
MQQEAQEHPISTKGEFQGVGRPCPRFLNKEEGKYE